MLSRLTDLIIDWVREGFQDFFRKLNDQFLVLSGKKYSANQDLTFGEGMQGDKVLPELVLVLAQLSVFIEQNAITRITEARNCLIGTSVQLPDLGHLNAFLDLFQNFRKYLLFLVVGLGAMKIVQLLFVKKFALSFDQLVKNSCSMYVSRF